MTKSAFTAALKRRGIVRSKGLGGYFYISANCMAYAANGGPTFREKLAYLIREQQRYPHPF